MDLTKTQTQYVIDGLYKEIQFYKEQKNSKAVQEAQLLLDAVLEEGEKNALEKENNL